MKNDKLFLRALIVNAYKMGLTLSYFSRNTLTEEERHNGGIENIVHTVYDELNARIRVRNIIYWCIIALLLLIIYLQMK